MSKTYLLTAPAPRVIVRPRLDAQGAPVLDAQGKHIMDVQEVVSPLLGYDLALQSVTQGPKLFEVWALRKRIRTLREEIPTDAMEPAYLILDETEREVLLQGFRTLDWTFQGKHTFWVEWEQLFDSVSSLTEHDATKPDAAYVQWKRRHEERVEAHKAAIRAAEDQALEAARQLDAAPAQEPKTDAEPTCAENA